MYVVLCTKSTMCIKIGRYIFMTQINKFKNFYRNYDLRSSGDKVL